MTKILFISHYLDRAGTEAFMMNVFRGIDASKFHIDFLIFSQEETGYSKEIESTGAIVYRLPSRRNHPFAYYRSLNQFFQQHASHYHAIHWCGNSLSSMLPIYFAWKYRIPVRIVHGHNSYAQGLHNRLFHILFRRFVASITPHHLACSTSAAQWFFPNCESLVIKNGINLSAYTYNPNKRNLLRKQLNISPDTIVLGHVGRFTTEKNHTFLLQIFEHYQAFHPSSLLMLVGKGPLKQNINMQITQLGLQNKVLLLGERNDVNELLQAMDCFVMPSLFEGLPFVLVEAQAASLPCVLSDTISKDCVLTNCISFINLQASVDQWCNTIDNALSQKRAGTATLKDSGFDIQDTISILEQIYLS